MNAVRTSLFGAQVCTTQNSLTLSLHTAQQTTALLPKTYCFIRAKLPSYTTRYSVFSINHAH